MKNKCVCCLTEGSDKKKFTNFTATDKKFYHELTTLDVNLKAQKICAKCKHSLQETSQFVRMCIKSHDELTSEVKTEAIQSKRTRRSARKISEEPFEDFVRDDSMSENEGDQEIQQELLIEELPPIQLPVEVKVEEQKIITVITTQDTTNIKSPNVCKECGICFKTAQRLEIHSYTHSGIKNWKCNECDKVFATKYRLGAHSRLHTGERPFHCESCPMSFAQGNALKCHRRVHTKERPFVCQICMKSFSQNTTLKTHMAALHTGKNIECDEPGCNKKFTRRSYLLLHKRDHAGERKYSCDRCPNHYKQKSHLDRHIEASHLGIRHKCNFLGCTSEFSKSWSLKMHKFVHTTEADKLPYQCETCKIGFQRRDKLLKHRTKLHPGEKTKDAIEIKEPEISSQTTTNFVVLTSTPEIYTIQNLDGSFTQVQTLQVVKGSK